jgi:predicted nucleotidyltransferase
MNILENKTANEFIENLKKREDVLGIILFGSWARGNNRPNSDVDLVVILSKGYRRTVEYLNDIAFEIIYTTDKSALKFWKDNKDDCHGLWEVAEVLYDKNETIKKLRLKVEKILKVGKKAFDNFQLGQLKFDAEDQIKFIEEISKNDLITANLILNNKVVALTEKFFDVRRLWTPAPKQRISEIKKVNNNFYLLLGEFYVDSKEIDEKIKIAKRMIPIVFDF